MPALSPKDLALLKKEKGLCLSIVMPLHRAAAQTREDVLRLKNLLAKAEQRLAGKGLHGKRLDRFLAPLRDFLSEEASASHPSDGVMLLRSEKLWRRVELPSAPTEAFWVREGFVLDPLAEALEEGAGPFHILAVSKGSARLFAVEGDAISEVAVKGMPASMKDAWKGTKRVGKSLQFHTVRVGGRGIAMFSGGSAPRDEAKKETLAYLQKVAKAVEPLLKKEGVPLVFAGVEELFGAFRKFSGHRGLRTRFIRGNPEALTPKQLLAKARRILA